VDSSFNNTNIFQYLTDRHVVCWYSFSYLSCNVACHSFSTFFWSLKSLKLTDSYNLLWWRSFFAEENLSFSY